MLTIKITPIPSYLERKILKIIDLTNYGKLSDEEIKILKNKIKKYNNKYKKNLNYPIDIAFILSLRSAYIKDKLLKRHHLLEKNIKKIYPIYQKYNILKISLKFDFSPMTIFRNILKLKYKDKKKIKYLLRNPDELSDYDKKQFISANENDIFSSIDQGDQLEKSIEFENKVGKFLHKLNIKFTTQDELSNSQTETFGKPISTPDFLIDAPLKINNKEINWIDAKNFYGANTTMIKKSIEKQTKKYLKNYGSGCIIFSLNFSEKLSFDKILLLDYNNLINNKDK